MSDGDSSKHMTLIAAEHPVSCCCSSPRTLQKQTHTAQLGPPHKAALRCTPPTSFPLFFYCRRWGWDFDSVLAASDTAGTEESAAFTNCEVVERDLTLIQRFPAGHVSIRSPRGARWDPGARLQMPVFTIRHLRALSTESSSAG